MTDDQTRPIETPTPAGEPTPDGGPGAYPAASTAPVAAPKGSGRLRWLLALGVAGLALAVGIGAVVLLGAPASPEALRYIPGDAAMVAELRMDLPGDQMENLGDLLAHFPGFQDQATLPQKIDEAFSRLVKMGDPDADYVKDIKPYLAGPTFLAARKLESMSASGAGSKGLLVATTNGSASCATVFGDQTLTHETYLNLDISKTATGEIGCVVDGRFFLMGDPDTIKLGLDAHAAGTGLDKSARYTAARTQLGLDRLATIYVDGPGLVAVMSAASPDNPFADLAGAAPEWIAAGVRAEADALVFDAVIAPMPNATPAPGFQTYPPVHPVALAQLAPADTLIFMEAQGAGVSIHNAFSTLKSVPELAGPLAMLDQVGGIDGLIGWIEDFGVIVVPDGELAAGALLLVAKDAASASEKVTTVTTVLSLGALGGDVDVTETTIEGVEVTTVHIPDVSSLLGQVTGIPGGGVPVPSATPVPLDFSIAVRDRIIYFGIGDGIMAKILGVKAGASLADAAAFQRVISRSLANPQSLVYVAAGAGFDLLEKAIPAAELAKWTTDVKPYVDPIEGLAMTASGVGAYSSMRFTITVANP